MREIRTLGSVGAKAEWLSYPTIPEQTHGIWKPFVQGIIRKRRILITEGMTRMIMIRGWD